MSPAAPYQVGPYLGLSLRFVREVFGLPPVYPDAYTAHKALWDAGAITLFTDAQPDPDDLCIVFFETMLPYGNTAIVLPGYRVLGIDHQGYPQVLHLSNIETLGAPLGWTTRARYLEVAARADQPDH